MDDPVAQFQRKYRLIKFENLYKEINVFKKLLDGIHGKVCATERS